MANNTQYGYGALENNTGQNNTAFGTYAAYSNTDASNNTAVGSNSAFFNTTGINNTSVGAGSLCNNTTGSLNTALGSSALECLTGSAADQNTAVGAQALYSINTGDLNTAIGTYAGLNLTTGSNNTFLGANTDAITSSISNSTAIGYGAIVDASNQIMMGSQTTQKVIIHGNTFMPDFTITADPTQVVPKSYVDTMSGGLKPAQTCVCATTADIDLNSTAAPPSTSTDGYDLSLLPDGTYNVLVVNQAGLPDTLTLDIKNGVYILTISGSGTNYSWARPSLGAPMCIGSDAYSSFSFVLYGSKFGSKALVEYYKDPVSKEAIVGTDPLQYQIIYQFDYKLGQGLNSVFDNPDYYINVDSSLNFINYLDSTSGVTGASGILSLGTESTHTIIGQTGGNPILFQSQIQAPGGITGATGHFTYLKAKEQIEAQGGITGKTGSFTNLSASQQIQAPGGITGATGSFTNLSASQQIQALAGITGATGSFTYLSASQQIQAPGGITGATGSFSNLSASQQIQAPGGITGATGSFTDLYVSGNSIVGTSVSQQLGTWTVIPTSPPINAPTNVIQLSSSSNGKYIVALTLDSVYQSSDYGSTWITGYTNVNPTYFQNGGISMSPSGQYCVAYAPNADYTSGDNGVIANTTYGAGGWAPVGNVAYGFSGWVSMVVSDYGLIFASTVLLEDIFVKTIGGGGTSLPRPTYSNFGYTCMAPRALLNDIVVYFGIYVQYYNGTTGIWTVKSTSAPQLTITSGAAISDDATYMSVLSGSSPSLTIYYSLDGGSNWSPGSGAPTANWTSIDIDGSGRYQTACSTDQGIWYSNNYGQSWTISGAATNLSWNSIRTLPNASTAVASVSNSNIYLGSGEPPSYITLTGVVTITGTIDVNGTISGTTGSFTYLSASQQIQAPGGITGATGSFTNLSASQQIQAPGGITGATGSFTYLSASQQIQAPGGITGATGSFTYLSASQQIQAPGGITGATGHFTHLAAKDQILARGGITGATGSFTYLSATEQIQAPGGITGATGSFTYLSVSEELIAPIKITGGSGSFTDLIVTAEVEAQGGITGATGSFTYLSASQQIQAPGGITGATGSFTYLSASQQIQAPGGITGATGSFTNLSATEQIQAPGGITGATGSFTYLSASQQIQAPGGITGATGSFTYLSASEIISAPGGITGTVGYFSGTVTANNFQSLSDYRIKENVVPLNEKFILDPLIPVTYTNTRTNKQDIGVIAHELGKVYPYLVEGEKDGIHFQSVNYNGLIGILIKEVKDLKARVKALEEK